MSEQTLRSEIQHKTEISPHVRSPTHPVCNTAGLAQNKPSQEGVQQEQGTVTGVYLAW